MAEDRRRGRLPDPALTSGRGHWFSNSSCYGRTLPGWARREVSGLCWGLCRLSQIPISIFSPLPARKTGGHGQRDSHRMNVHFFICKMGTIPTSDFTAIMRCCSFDFRKFE